MKIVKATSDFLYQKFIKSNKSKRFLFFAIVTIFIASYSIYLDTAIWTLSALGRIVMIKLLPFWDWTHLYNARCLISKPSVPKQYQAKEYPFKDCHLCEKLDYIKVLNNITFLQLRDNFIYKAQPVLIKNSSNLIKVSELLQKLFESRDFLESSPCDVETNLIQSKFFNLEEVLTYIEKDFDGSWFLQLRNCQFFAVKSSRQFLEKPYFYADHMEPYYSSWLLMSNNYAGLDKKIKLHGLIILQQLQGDLIISLVPEAECINKCKQQNIVIKSGESLIFSTDLWTMKYFVDLNQMILTTIMEVYF